MIKKYKMNVYPRALYVAVDETEESIREYLNSNKGDDIPTFQENSNAYTLPVSDGTDGGSLIRFIGKDALTQDIIAHECFHAVMDVCLYLDIKFDTGDNHEHVAYMLQWAVNMVHDFVLQYEREILSKKIRPR